MKFFLRMVSFLLLHAAASAGPVSRHRFDDAANLGANSGFATVPWASFANVAWNATAKFGGGSASFVRGSSQAVTGSFDATAARTNRFTLSMHVRANMGDTALDNWPDFVSIGIPAGHARFAIEATGTGGGIALYKFSSATATDGYALGTITTNAWNHLALVADGTTATLYVNGVASGNPIPHTAAETISAVTLASRFGSATRGITTLIDDVALYDIALGAAQISWLAQNPAFTSYAGWSGQIPYSARRGPWVDQDGDGANNLSEYYFGTSPMTPGGEILAAEFNAAGPLVLHWLQLESGADYKIERNSTLQGAWIAATGVVAAPDPDRSAPPGYVARKAEVPIGPASDFLRVQATSVADPGAPAESEIPPLPATAVLAMQETWNSGQIDPARWYIPRKKWGQGNNGVAPANVRIETDNVWGSNRPVLVCQANGDLYDGPVTGHGGQKPRVGGIVVTRDFFASGRYEMTMKIGGTAALVGAPADPMRPIGTVPAVWTYGYRYVSVASDFDSFHPEQPLYNPHMKVYGNANEYWSELDFPEFGANGNFDIGLYNTFLQNKHQGRSYNVAPMIDGQYHTLTTDWRTALVPIAGVTDAQVIASDGYFWVRDKAINFNLYLGNPLKRLGPDQYAVLAGTMATHYLDGKKVGGNPTFVPSMAGQLTLGVWLPDWGGPAPWKQSTVSFSSIRIWQFHDPGDVRGIITENITDNY